MLKVISGGQTGVDQAALSAAKEAGLFTGGWMPYGWMTLEGVREDFRELYGMQECPEQGYGPRTDWNARDSDVTLRIAKNFGSAGERCTLSAIRRHGKTHVDISAKKLAGADPGLMVDWLIKRKVTTLNVAGNSETTAPGIYGAARAFLLAVFIAWRDAADATKRQAAD